MRILFRPYNLVFYVLVLFIFFTAGAAFASMAGVAEGQGLAGGAIVLFYGVVVAFFAFVAALFAAYRAKKGTIVRINKILVVVSIVIFIVLTWRYQQQADEIKKSDTSLEELPKKPTIGATQ